MHKGDKLYVEGRLRYSVYNDKLGQRRNVTEILVASMEMLSPRPQQPVTNPAARPSQPEPNETKPNQLPF